MSVDNKNLSEIDLGNIIKNIVSYKFSVLLITFFITLISLSLYYFQEKAFTIKYEIKPLESLGLYFPSEVKNIFLGEAGDSIGQFFLETYYDNYQEEFNNNVSNLDIDDDKILEIRKSFDSVYNKDIEGYIFQFKSNISAKDAKTIILDTIKKTNQIVLDNLTLNLERIIDTQSKIIQTTENIFGQVILTDELEIDIIKLAERQNLETSLNILNENLNIAKKLGFKSDLNTNLMLIEPQKNDFEIYNPSDLNTNLMLIEPQKNDFDIGALASALSLGLPSYLSGEEILNLEINRIKSLIDSEKYRGIGTNLNYLISKKEILSNKKFLENSNKSNLLKYPEARQNILEKLLIIEEIKPVLNLLKNKTIVQVVSFDENKIRYEANFFNFYNLLMIGVTIGFLISLLYIVTKEFSKV